MRGHPKEESENIMTEAKTLLLNTTPANRSKEAFLACDATYLSFGFMEYTFSDGSKLIRSPNGGWSHERA